MKEKYYYVILFCYCREAALFGCSGCLVFLATGIMCGMFQIFKNEKNYLVPFGSRNGLSKEVMRILKFLRMMYHPQN